MSIDEVVKVAVNLGNRYGPIPHATEQLVRMLELKLVAKSTGCSRIKPEGKQHVVMETFLRLVKSAWG
ncbi:MAG: TRCF domain-containing protein [Nodosilinea sp.]